MKSFLLSRPLRGLLAVSAIFGVFLGPGSAAVPNVTNTPGGTQTIVVNQSVSYASEATDADADMFVHSFHWQDPEGRWNWQNNGASGLSLSGPSEVWFAGDPSSVRSITVTATRTGTFQIKWAAADPNGWFDSPVYSLVVQDAPVPPSITSHPEDQSASPGDSVTFTVAANGTGPLSYQWRKGGANLAGANSSSLTIGNVQASHAGSYDVVVGNAAGSDTSDPAILTVTGVAPQVDITPSDHRSVSLGEPITYGSTATDGDGDMFVHSFHWRDPEGRWNWENNGANGLTLDGPMDVWFGGDASSSRLITVTPTRTGTFQIKWSAADPGGWVESGTYNLVVDDGGPSTPAVTINPAAHQAIPLNGTFTYTSDATDPDGDMFVHAFHWRDPEGRWNWENNGANGLSLSGPSEAWFSGDPSSARTMTVTGTREGTFKVKWSAADPNGWFESGTFDLVVGGGGGQDRPPTITAHPQSRTVSAGSTASFSVGASGQPLPTYQWRKGGINLAGATGATLTVNNVQPENEGIYDVVVTNPLGSVTSNPATLRIGTASLVITEHPRSQRRNPGDEVAFSVAVTGTGSVNYQWWKGAAEVPGATGATLLLENVDAGAAGTYYVVVRDASGSKTSIPATLIIEPRYPREGEPPAIMEVRTAAPDVLVVVVQTPVTYIPKGQTTPDDLGSALNPASWRVGNAQPQAVHRYSIPWDEDPQVPWNAPAHPEKYPVMTRHRLYLVLAAPLAEGTTYSLTNPYGDPQSFTFRSTTTFCESIKVNQVGYSTVGESRFANFGVFMGDGGPRTVPDVTYNVIDERTGLPLWPEPRAAGSVIDDVGMGGINSGERVYRLSLDAVPEGGPYFVTVTGAGRSRSFGVGDTCSRHLARVTMRGIFHQRCGMALDHPFTAWTHGSCHNSIAYWLRSPHDEDSVAVGPNERQKQIAGGYHDAADMDHTTAHPQISINMLTFFEAFADRFDDDQYNIPESGNGLPDFLDEILWGVKLWENLQFMESETDPDYRGVMSGWSTNATTTYGVERADHDPFLYGTMMVRLNSTAFCAGIFAHTSRLLLRTAPNDPDRVRHAEALLKRAKDAWLYLKANGDVNRAETHYVYAALQLYLATNEAEYHEAFKVSARTLLVEGRGYTEEEGYFPGNLNMLTHTPHFVSYLLPHGRATDPNLAQALSNKIIVNANGGPDNFARSPFLTAYPQGVTTDLGWGASTTQGRYADVLMYASLLTTDDTKRKEYINAVSLFADYSLGLNPMGLSYYAGLGTDQPVSPLDCNSYFTKYGRLPNGAEAYLDVARNPIGNVPGILVYGPTAEPVHELPPYERVVADKLHPAWNALPPPRRFAHGWSLIHVNEYTTHQTMVWNALMYAFLDKR